MSLIRPNLFSLRHAVSRASPAIVNGSNSVFWLSNGSDKRNEEIEEWIPPDRPLSGDKSQGGGGTAERSKNEEPIDWSQSRHDFPRKKAIAMTMPNKNRRFAQVELEIKPRVLLERDEIKSCLTALGGLNYVYIPDNKEQPRLGGATGLMIVTASSTQHVNIMSDTMVRQLRNRNLQDLGVVGAQLGVEGENGDTWHVVDCLNFVVHIQTEGARKAIDLESLWGGQDPFFSVDHKNDEEVEEYIANYPPKSFTTEMVNVKDVVSGLEKYNIKHKSVVNRPRRKHGNRKRGRR